MTHSVAMQKALSVRKKDFLDNVQAIVPIWYQKMLVVYVIGHVFGLNMYYWQLLFVELFIQFKHLLGA